jgi:hypothetical protein
VDVSLQAGAEERPEERDHLGRVAANVTHVDRLVVLVDQDHRPLAVAAVQGTAEIQQRALVDRAAGGAVENGLEVGGLPPGEAAIREQIAVLIEERADLPLDRLPCEVPALGLHVLEGEAHDRIASEVRPVYIARLPDG